MKVYQLTLRGFDGSTDETDHLIIWVKAPSIDDVSLVCKEHDLDYVSIDEIDIGLDDEMDIGLGLEDIGIDYEVFENRYKHCGIGWTSNWTSQCNDECPVCGKEIEPHNS